MLKPSAVIDVPDSTGMIALTTDGKTVWASTNGAIVRIDIATNAARLLTAPTASGDTTLAIAADGLWATRWEGGKLYRLDPQTGAVQLSVEMPRAVRIAFVGSDLWVGREDVGKMFRVDRKTGAVGASVSQGAYGTAGMGDLWFASDGSPTILRVDPSTGVTKATIAAPGESNCGIGGPFPDSAWTGCFGREVEPRSAARIDPASNSLAAVVSLPPSHGVASVVVLDGATWVVASLRAIDDGTPLTGLLRVDRTPARSSARSRCRASTRTGPSWPAAPSGSPTRRATVSCAWTPPSWPADRPAVGSQLRRCSTASTHWDSTS